MKWISVKEKIPPLDTDVLVLYEDEYELKSAQYCKRIPSFMKVAHMYERLLGSDNWETEESKKDILRWSLPYNITHWMPLPEPPKENE